ncbi:MAG TPA: hypothetical protein VL860_06720 [Planctomycetota bacterium]|nr:hypothetical protein [Planctomycetota bacterium]
MSSAYPRPDPGPKPPPKDWSRSLLGWYYSTSGTLIRLAFYAVIIGLLVIWRMGWLSKPVTVDRKLDHLEVLSWKEKRWAAEIPLSTKLNQFPYIEVTLAEPDGYGVNYKLADLAEQLRLFWPTEPHSLLSLPIETFDTSGAPDGAAATSDDETKPRSFNHQVILSFLINPDALDKMPAEIWIGYVDAGTDAAPTPPKLTRLATLTKETFKGAEMRKMEPPPAALPTPAALVPAPAPAPESPAPPAESAAPPAGPVRPADPPALPANP